jgi:Domain of unknown function (DUF222)
MGRGEFSRAHAVKLVHAVDDLPHDAALEVQERVPGQAFHQSVSQFAATVRRAVLAVDPRGEDDKHRDEVAKRRVVFTPQDHGVTELWSQLPTEGAAVLQARLDNMVKQWKKLKDGRSADQLRADALVQLALGAGAATGPVGLKPAINVTVALSTPTISLGSWTVTARSRQRWLVFPRCNRRAIDSDLDHIIPWGTPGGDTTPENLEPVMRPAPSLEARDQLARPTPARCTTRWTSPTGHIYDRPPDELPTDTTMNDPDPPATDDSTDDSDAPPF